MIKQRIISNNYLPRLMPVLTHRPFATTSLKADLYKNQDLLPRLPVPSLDDTVQKYVRSVEPFLTKEQLSESLSKAQDFVKPGGFGHTLQTRLEHFAKDKDNWLAEWWDDYAYMSYRDPVSPYVSYFFSHKEIRNAVGEDQLLKAALLAYYTIEFAESVNSCTMLPEIIKGLPYCMNAFRFMFNNSRVPQPGSDVTKSYDPSQNKYFVVAFQNNFYKVEFIKPDGSFLSKGEIYWQLNAILNSTHLSGEPVGALTSMNRDDYCAAYEHMLKSPVNQASFESIFASSFVLCLDDVSPVTVEEKSRYSWHGDGMNRFFDKPLQLFVAKNGHSGFLGEHSRMDATPTVQLNNTIMKQISSEDLAALIKEVNSTSKYVEQHPQLLNFDIDPVTRSNISSAKSSFNRTMSTFHHEVFQYFGYGKGLIKTFKVSPDAYVQMMMQLAYFKLTGKVRPTYESAATRKFLKGRTETGRTVSVESKNFVETWTNPNSTVADKVASFQTACKQHVSYLSAAADGLGVDRHLFGLKQMLKPGEEVPALFSDPIMSYSATWYISSSQVPSEYFQNWGWSQVTDSGFGLAYLINNDSLSINISARKGNGLRSDHLKHYLLDTANEMKQVLSEGSAPVKAKL